MEKPDDCPDEFYDLMIQCWSQDPDDRPTFAKLFALIADIIGSFTDGVSIFRRFLCNQNFNFLWEQFFVSTKLQHSKENQRHVNNNNSDSYLILWLGRVIETLKGESKLQTIIGFHLLKITQKKFPPTHNMYKYFFKGGGAPLLTANHFFNLTLIRVVRLNSLWSLQSLWMAWKNKDIVKHNN